MENNTISSIFTPKCEAAHSSHPFTSNEANKGWSKAVDTPSIDIRTTESRCVQDMFANISNAPTTFALLELTDKYGRHLQELTAVHLCTIFHRLAKMTRRLSPLKKSALLNDGRVTWLAAELERSLPCLGAQALSNIAWAHTILGHGSTSLMASVKEEALRKIAEFNSLEIGIIMNAFGRDELPCADFLAAMANERVKGQLHLFTTRQIKEIVWSHAKHGIRDAELFDEVATNIQSRMEEVDLISMATILWSYAKLAEKNPEFFLSAADWLLGQEAKLNPRDISSIAWTYAKVVIYRHDLFDMLTSSMAGFMQQASPQVVSNTVWACATLNHYDEEFMAAAADRMLVILPSCQPHVVATTAWGFASLTHYSDKMFESILSMATRNMASYKPSYLAMLAFSCAVFALHDEQFMQALTLQCEEAIMAARDHEQEELMSHTTLVLLAWSFVVLGHYPPAIIPILRDRLANVHDFQPAQLCQLYQVELAVRLESPQLGQVARAHWPEDVNARDYLHSLWLNGYLRQKAKDCWDALTVHQAPCVSSFQVEISAVLTSLDICHVSEYSEGDYSIDIAILHAGSGLKVAVEADGPAHFSVNCKGMPLGQTLLKARMLTLMDWNVVQIAYFEWAKLTSLSSKQQYLEDRLAAFDLPRASRNELPTESVGESSDNNNVPVGGADEQSDVVKLSEEGKDFVKLELLNRVVKGRKESKGQLKSIINVAIRRGLKQP